MKSTGYRIGEMADYLGISKEMIRYYEKCGVIHPQRLKDNNYRTYSFMDLFMLSEMLQLKEWGISVRDIAAMKNHQYTETVLACYKKALDSLNSDISLLELRKMRLSSLIDEIQTCTMNVGNYWVEQRHEGFWIEVGEGQGDEYSSLATPMEMRKWLYNPRNIVFWDSMCFLNETGTIWGSFLDSRYTQELGFHTESAGRHLPESACLCTIIEMGKPGTFREDCIKPALSVCRKKGFLQTGEIMGTSLARGMEGDTFRRYLKIQIPIQKP